MSEDLSEDFRLGVAYVGGLVEMSEDLSEDLRRTCTRRVIRLTRAEVSWISCN